MPCVVSRIITTLSYIYELMQVQNVGPNRLYFPLVPGGLLFQFLMRFHPILLGWFNSGYTRRGLTDRFFFAKIDRAGRAEYNIDKRQIICDIQPFPFGKDTVMQIVILTLIPSTI